MSIKIYDEALVSKLKKWTDKTSIQIVSPDETDRLFSSMIDQNEDKPLQLPIISLRRDRGFDVDILGKRHFTSNGSLIASNEEKSIIVNAIPITIPYTIDVYTRYRSEAEEFAQNLIFNIVNYPKLNVVIQYKGLSFAHDSNIRITGSVNDTSDAPPRLRGGQFTRYSIGIDIDDAYLWDLRTKKNLSIASIDVVTNDEN